VLSGAARNVFDFLWRRQNGRCGQTISRIVSLRLGLSGLVVFGWVLTGKRPSLPTTARLHGRSNTIDLRFRIMRRIGLHNCPYCGKDEIYVSPPKTWRDEVCCFFFLQVVICHSCMRRHYRPLFLPPVPIASVRRPIQTTDNDEQRERSA
jgi:hypothetical protein